ncbi:DinB family protein [Salisaeta longa]|uniref:DinB family protein n=1 Tax=Salisaeta longa TaxID=503170 RepID=UPI0003B3092A|nr:DinB family protein [Salisaeta longa]
MALPEPLASYSTQLRSLNDEVQALLERTPADALNAKPGRGEWSAAQCIDHLDEAGRLLLPRLEAAIETAKASGPFADPPFQYGFVSRLMVRLLRPESRWKFPAPEGYRPEPISNCAPSRLATDFADMQERFVACCAAAEGLDLRSIRVTSPVVPFLRISLGAWFEATIQHERRHLKQARQTLAVVRG